MKASSHFVMCAIAAGMLITGASLRLNAVAQTQNPPAPPARADSAMPPHGAMREGGREMGHHGMGMMRELARLKASLKLTPEQAALWDRAEAGMRPPADLRERMKARHDRMAAALDDPNFDPRKLAAGMDKDHADMDARRRATRDTWFGVYDSLNPAQRGQVRELLRARMARADTMRGHWRDHMHRGMENAPLVPPVPPVRP